MPPLSQKLFKKYICWNSALHYLKCSLYLKIRFDRLQYEIPIATSKVQQRKSCLIWKGRRGSVAPLKTKYMEKNMRRCGNINPSRISLNWDFFPLKIMNWKWWRQKLGSIFISSYAVLCGAWWNIDVSESKTVKESEDPWGNQNYIHYKKRCTMSQCILILSMVLQQLSDNLR